jgi:hypothetical protein
MPEATLLTLLFLWCIVHADEVPMYIDCVLRRLLWKR